MASSSVMRTGGGCVVSARGGLAGCGGRGFCCCAAANAGSSATNIVARAHPFFIETFLIGPAEGLVAASGMDGGARTKRNYAAGGARGDVARGIKGALAAVWAKTSRRAVSETKVMSGEGA